MKAKNTVALMRKIVDYQKLNEAILSLLVENYPDGYKEKDIITFRNMHGELIEAVEVRTDDTIYLVKVGKRLVQAMEDFELEEDEDEEEGEDFSEFGEEYMDD